MATAFITRSGSAFGFLQDETIKVEADNGLSFRGTLDPAKKGQLTTRTDSVTGVLTMGAGHGIQTGNRIDIYFDGGVLYDTTVGTVSGNLVPFGTTGQGSNLPANLSQVTAQVRHIDTNGWNFQGGQLQGLIIGGTKKCVISFYDNTGPVTTIQLLRENGTFVWTYLDDPNNAANPLSGVSVIKIGVTNGDGDNSNPITVLALVN